MILGCANLQGHVIRGKFFVCSSCHQGNLMPLLWRGCLHGCDLLVASPVSKEQRKFLHPTCQCMSRPQRVPGTSSLARGGGLITDVQMRTVRGRQIPVPHWVARSKMTAAAARADACQPSILKVFPRFQDASEKQMFNRVCIIPNRVTGQQNFVARAETEFSM